MGQPLKFGKGAGPTDGSTQCPCPGGAKGNALIVGQIVPRDDVSSAASGWSKCEKKRSFIDGDSASNQSMWKFQSHTFYPEKSCGENLKVWVFTTDYAATFLIMLSLPRRNCM